MDKKELAFAKQSIVSVKDWDAYQEIIRFLAQLVKSTPEKVCRSSGNSRTC